MADGDDDVFMVEYSIVGQGPPMAAEGAVEEPWEAPADGDTTPPPSPHAAAGEASGGSNGAQAVEFASPPAGGDDNLDTDHDEDAPLLFRKLKNILGPSSLLGFAPRALLTEELHAVSSDEPASFTEAERCPSWRKAMMEERSRLRTIRPGALLISRLGGGRLG